MKLTDMHIVLTGATGGIGNACARQLSQAGARIIAVGRDRQRLTALLEQLSPHPSAPHLFFCADITDAQQRQQLGEQLSVLTPPANTLINMAGLGGLALFEQQSEAQIQALLDTNLSANMLLTHRLLPLLKQQPQARIVNVGSIFGSIGYPGYVSYCASKFALRGFSEALCRELADSPVRVQYFAPRATRTTLNSPAANALNEALNTTTDSPETVARQLTEFIQQSASSRYLGWPETLFVRINGLLPGVVSRAIRKQLSTIKQHAAGL